MSTQNQMPTPEQAHAYVVDIHKRAYLGRLAEHGEVPQTEKEAVALLDLGFDLLKATGTDPLVKAAAGGESEYGDGPYAQVKLALSEQLGTDVAAPGFAKAASQFTGAGPTLPDLPPALIDASYQAAFELAHDPFVYNAAVVKRAENARVEALVQKQAESQPQEKVPEEAATAA